MKNESAKSTIKNVTKTASQRVDAEVKRAAKALLKTINNKNSGRSVRSSQLFAFALGLVKEEHIKLLQERSMTNEDRKEILRQKWSEINGPISKDEFTGLMLTPEFSQFLSEHHHNINVL